MFATRRLLSAKQMLDQFGFCKGWLVLIQQALDLCPNGLMQNRNQKSGVLHDGAAFLRSNLKQNACLSV